MGALDRHLEHARRQRPAHDRSSWPPGSRLREPAGRGRGAVHDRRDRPPRRPRRPGGGRDTEGRDDGARALPGAPAPRRTRPPCRDGGAAPSAAEEFLSWLEVERGRSPRTLAAYRQRPRRLRGGRGGSAPVSASTPQPPPTWRRTWPRSAGRHTARPRWPGRIRASGASTASWSRRAARADDPALDLPSISVTDLLPKALSEEETERLLGAVVGTGPLVLRDRALLEVLYGTGARVSEVVGLNLGDVADAVEAVDLPLVPRARQGRQGARRPAGPARPRRPGRLALGPGAPPPRAEEVATARRRRGRLPQRPWRTALPGGGVRRGQEVRRPGRSARRRSAPTSCGTRAPHTCWAGGRTCGSSRSCWDTPPSPRRSATPRCRPNTCGGPTREPTRGREQGGGGTA